MYKKIPGNTQRCHKTCNVCGGSKYQDDYIPPIPNTEFCGRCKGSGIIEVDIETEIDRINSHMMAINKQFLDYQKDVMILRGYK